MSTSMGGPCSSERARVEMLRAVFDSARSARTMVGIGDDAAVLAPSTQPLVWTVDAQVEHVHFRRDLISMQDLGYRATMAAASDLAAMGAAPLGILSSLVLPMDIDDDDLRAIAHGQREASDELGTAIVGGNLARGAELSITTTVLGETARPLTREGARTSDIVVLVGPLGLSAAGLRLLEASIGKTNDRLDKHPDALDAVRAFRRPVARIADALAARHVATAAIDVSDGLVRDLGHVARASRVCITLDPETLVTPSLERAAQLVGADPLALALHGGEDYALVMTVPSDRVPPGFVSIGQISTGPPEVGFVDDDGLFVPYKEHGYDHFQ